VIAARLAWADEKNLKRAFAEIDRAAQGIRGIPTLEELYRDNPEMLRKFEEARKRAGKRVKK